MGSFIAHTLCYASWTFKPYTEFLILRVNILLYKKWAEIGQCSFLCRLNIQAIYKDTNVNGQFYYINKMGSNMAHILFMQIGY